ncbi:hypothetical protein [Verminephrobacter aporrectodeae]|uniref:Uncharacterized protein n=1 Tax=Verminephrobacter aporrectodeae subsp. tuberculatae TaxID=1110392 RepID=A0ABT3KP09_9BURK|nr:hypothetical protein [Verminephrobacter aporrectodeae]MCW5221455.1 hypothetical protein [Verminephrobacter aporrectodeae subsp. tuberculatae]MCW5257766.1 hypothetical protein [Verminephrobacter aporrectodeae subsp. tuberculatae]MCW5290747.1 hypothetical protein [Verminephrobacter aporrectodeae subsp. tuberculatae]MCW5320053.1 hypothetical protein [Verminephrobacter aporrectodeae subsp. tuberculatae]MCW8167176.1 hypothetical protein [Verminephrobacter aporrectodeae subsp. tuberculatae]
MTLSSHGLAIVALLATSVLVRVLPVFVRLRLSDTARSLLERVLPMAVFLNFAIYIALTEIRTAPVAAIAAIAVVGIITLSTRLGLLLTTLAGTVVYVLTQMAAQA